jgi:hypothetical protein
MVGLPECEADHTTDNDRRLIPKMAGFRVGTDAYVKVRTLLRAFRGQHFDLANGALGEHRRPDTEGMRLEIDAPGCRSSVRRSTAPT